MQHVGRYQKRCILNVCIRCIATYAMPTLEEAIILA
jgi:hypothetical protein